MAVVVLMYHHTPAGGAGRLLRRRPLDFPRPDRSACATPACRSSGSANARAANMSSAAAMSPSTFDDGHASNDAAFRFLADRRRRRRWRSSCATGRCATGAISRRAALADLAEVCEVGGHGATHRALTSLSDAELADELAASRDYVADDRRAARRRDGAAGRTWRRARTRRRREGRFPARRQFAAVAADAGSALGVNRICINRTHDAQAPLRCAQASALHWGMRARALRRHRRRAAADGRQALRRVGGLGEVGVGRGRRRRLSAAAQFRRPWRASRSARSSTELPLVEAAQMASLRDRLALGGMVEVIGDLLDHLRGALEHRAFPAFGEILAPLPPCARAA